MSNNLNHLLHFVNMTYEDFWVICFWITWDKVNPITNIPISMKFYSKILHKGPFSFPPTSQGVSKFSSLSI